MQERKKELVDHREDSTFSFDPSSLNVRKLSKHKIKKIDARKGVLLSSYTRKKTRRRKRNRSTNNPTKSPGTLSAAVEAANAKEESKDTAKSSPKPNRSLSPSPNSSPRNSRSSPRPQKLPLPLPPPKHVQLAPDTLHLSAPLRSGLCSRQGSSNSGEGGNRESSLDDSGVVDDHETEGDATSEDVASNIPPPQQPQTRTKLVEDRVRIDPGELLQQRIEVTPVTVTLSPKEIKVIKCNGVGTCKKKKHMYSLPPDYLSHIVVIGK